MIQTYDEHGAVENTQASGRPGASSSQEKGFSDYFNQYQSRSPRLVIFNSSTALNSCYTPKQTSNVSVQSSCRTAT